MPKTVQPGFNLVIEILLVVTMRHSALHLMVQGSFNLVIEILLVVTGLLHPGGGGLA